MVPLNMVLSCQPLEFEVLTSAVVVCNYRPAAPVGGQLRTRDLPGLSFRYSHATEVMLPAQSRACTNMLLPAGHSAMVELRAMRHGCAIVQRP